MLRKPLSFVLGFFWCGFFFGGGEGWVLKIKAPRPSSKLISVTIPHSPQLFIILDVEYLSDG